MEKLSSIELAEKMSEAIRQFRQKEINNPGAGYIALENFKTELPIEIYSAFKICLDNPQAELKFNIHYHKK